jgi:hypothetical protein
VFDSQGRLILVGRESSIADDQPASSTTLSLDDLSRGSVGKLDPFIGPVIANEGTNYTFAVSSNQQMPIQLQQFAQMTPVNSLTRLEPIESVARVVEDHIGTSGFVAANLVPVAPQTAIFNIDTVTNLDTHIVPFTFDDVRLYISDNSNLYSIDAQSARNFVTVGAAGNVNERLRDITIRTDGRLFGYRDRDTNTNPGSNDVGNTAGAIINYDPGNAAVRSQTDDGIRGPVGGAVFGFTPAVNASDVTYTDGVEALTYRRNSYVDSNTVDYDLFLSVSDPLAGAPLGGTGYSKLFVDLDGPTPDGAVNQNDTTITNRGFVGYIGGAVRGTDARGMNGASITFIASRAGSLGDGTTLRVLQNGSNAGGNVGNGLDVQAAGNQIVVTVFNDSGNRSLTAQQLVDAINSNVNARSVGIAQLNTGGGNRISDGTGTPPNPNVGNQTWTTGGGVDGTLLGRTTGIAFLGGTLYGVSDAGEFFTINTANGNANVLRTYAGTNFQGLALGPQNLDANRDRTPEYADFLFAITANGQLRAIDTNSVNSDPAIFAGGATTLNTGVASPTGLAFSNLDFNLWHPTTQQGGVPGHGINPTFNNSRPPVALRRAECGRRSVRSVGRRPSRSVNESDQPQHVRSAGRREGQTADRSVQLGQHRGPGHADPLFQLPVAYAGGEWGDERQRPRVHFTRWRDHMGASGQQQQCPRERNRAGLHPQRHLQSGRRSQLGADHAPTQRYRRAASAGTVRHEPMAASAS